jgi:alcohol dehydrogenase class IV
MDYQDLTGSWNYPTGIVAGEGTVAQLPDCCKQLGMARPLLVTDPGLAALPMVDASLSDCRLAGIDAGLFSNIKGNPTGRNVADGVSAFDRGTHDGIIAFGGGSAIDAAKAIALMVGQQRPLWDFVDLNDNWLLADEAGIATIIAVPTTAGTGSEVGRAALIIDEERHLKRILFHPRLLPARVILDPQLTVGLPPAITAATGMDALSHNLEALCSPVYHPMAEGIAVEGIRLIGEYLPRAVANGADIEARMHMMAASSMGATAFQKGLGAMHALAHPLGALYDAHHGLLNAILMPYVLQVNKMAVGQRLQRMARYMGLRDPGYDSFLKWVIELRAQIAIPHTLGELGIDCSRQELVGEMAAADPTAATNPVPMSATQYSELFCRAVKGEL